MSREYYYKVKEMMFDYMDRVGAERPVPKSTNKSNAKYYYRQAVRYGDQASARIHKERFVKFGGDIEDLPQQVKLAHPMSGMSKTMRYDFRQSLSPDQEKILDRALEWYKESIFNGRGQQDSPA